jgi:hypothetical protein
MILEIIIDSDEIESWKPHGEFHGNYKLTLEIDCDVESVPAEHLDIDTGAGIQRNLISSAHSIVDRINSIKIIECISENGYIKKMNKELSRDFIDEHIEFFEDKILDEIEEMRK